MKTKIPFLKEGEEKDALVRTVDAAAAGANITSERFFIALTHWVEAVANEVSFGNVVPIPCIGKIAAVLEERQARLKRYNQGFPYSVPVFEPSDAFRAQVKTTAPTSRKGKRSLRIYRNHNHSPCTGKRPHATAAKYREAITRQLEDAGAEW
jgi:hypothetical protein